MKKIFHENFKPCCFHCPFCSYSFWMGFKYFFLYGKLFFVKPYALRQIVHLYLIVRISNIEMDGMNVHSWIGSFSIFIARLSGLK